MAKEIAPVLPLHPLEEFTQLFDQKTSGLGITGELQDPADEGGHGLLHIRITRATEDRVDRPLQEIDDRVVHTSSHHIAGGFLLQDLRELRRTLRLDSTQDLLDRLRCDEEGGDQPLMEAEVTHESLEDPA